MEGGSWRNSSQEIRKKWRKRRMELMEVREGEGRKCEKSGK